MTQRESPLLRAIHTAVGSLPTARVWRVNTGVAVPIGLCCPRCRAKGAVRFGLPGQADLMGILAPSGRMLSIEVKSDTGRMRPEQEAWAAMVTRFGGVSVAPCRSVEQALEAIR